MSPPSSMPASANSEGTVWQLPPLILHPFNEHVAPSTLLDNSKAALMLAGLIPGDGSDTENLTRRLLAGRYAEVRMLYFLGKDVFRWIDQCMEWADRLPELRGTEVHPQSFAGLLTRKPPPLVSQKLIGWGVADYVSIFSRAIGLHVVFAAPPALDGLAEEFLRNYHRYGDSLFHCYMDDQLRTASRDAGNFRFELYASGEYSRLLENEWGTAET